MSYFYQKLGQDSVKLDGSLDKEVIPFGESNTDQSFYEPIGTTISNMLRSGDVSSSHFIDNQPSDKELWEQPIFPNNLTQEEISQYKHEAEVSSEKLTQTLQEQALEIQKQLNESKIDNSVVQNSTSSD